MRTKLRCTCSIKKPETLGAFFIFMKKRKVTPEMNEQMLNILRNSGTEARGKIGDRIFSVSKKGKQFSRKRIKPSQMVTPSRKAAQSNFEPLNDAWKALPQEKKELWEKAVGLRVLRKNPEIRSRALIRIPSARISGSNYFMEVNLLAQSVGQTGIITEPPLIVFDRRIEWLPIPLPPVPVIRNAVLDGSKLTVFWVVPENSQPSRFIRIWVKSRGKVFHAQLAAKAPAEAGQVTVSELRGPKGAVVDGAKLAEATILIQAEVVDRDNGLASNPSRTFVFNVK